MEYTALPCPEPVGWWRSVEDSINAFVVECFVDELAAAAQKDPLQYRMGVLPAGRNIPGRDGTVIATSGRGRRLACHCCRGSYIAIVAEASVAAPNLPTVHRIWAAVDCGVAVFNDYRLLRMSESPVTEVRIIGSSAAPSGAGEIAVPPVAPAIANAIFQLTGRRVRSLPIAHALITS